MSRSYVRRRVLVPVLFSLWTGVAAAQGAATITGQIVDSLARSPVVGAQVYVNVNGGGASNTRGAVTNAAGRYTITAVPAGPLTIRVRMLGFAPAARTVTLQDGETATVDFALNGQTARLDQVVVTGTAGATQRRAIGNVIESIRAEDVLAVAPARSVEQVIGQRTPGLIVLPGSGQIGTGAQIRVRSVSSLSLNNDPIVYIDGVRMDADVSRGPGQRGGVGASRLNDVNPQDIESIEVIKGPAASTLYGTEASNGVIQIITKRGKSGKPRFDFVTRQGTNWLANPEGRAGLLWGREVATGNLVAFNLYKHEIEAGHGPIFHNGQTQGYALSVNGGSDATRYFTSLGYDNDVGVVSWNWDKKLTARANLDLLIGDKLRLQTNAAYIRDRVRLAQSAIDIDPFSNLVWGSPLTKDRIQRGFNTSPPEEWSTVESRADNDRTTTSLTTLFTPWSWFSNRLVTGLDVSSENNWNLYPRQPLGGLDPLGNNGLGNKRVVRVQRNVITLDYSGSAKYSWRQALQLTSSVGLQYFRRDASSITATGTTFPAIPITTVSGGATSSGAEEYVANATVGMFGQQEVAWNNRLFLTAALRGDDNSAFGTEFKAAYYPKLSAAWVVSEEPWWVQSRWIRDLRLRGALGAAGTQPGTFDASQLYDPSIGYLNAPGLIPASFGNPALKPERSTELEVGFEGTMLGGRTDISYTHYSRKITDAIVNSPLPPSTGFPGFQVVNIGKVSGWGDELSFNARVIEGPRFAWELGTQLAHNRNRIDNMGGTQFLTVGGGGQAQNRVGFGIGDFFLYKIRRATIDAGGFVTEAICDGGTGKSGLEQGGPDVPCASAPRVRWGASQPTWQAGVNTTVTLFRDLRLYARVDGNGGHYQSDTEIRAVHNLGLSEAVIRRNDPLLQAYRAIEADASGTYKAGFLRLREVSATYNLPARLTSRMGTSAASLSVAGRNLSMIWTAQNGWNTSRDGQVNVDIANMHVWDPETRAFGQLSNGFQTILPPTASFTATLRLNF